VDSSRHQSWVPAALLLGVLYVAVGRAFAAPVTHVRGWRLAAWIVCGVVFSAHIAYEHCSSRHSPRLVAWHAAIAVAIGAFLLAVAAMVHSLWTTSALRPVWFLAIFLWPAITAVPAFLVALAAAVILARLWPNAKAH